MCPVESRRNCLSENCAREAYPHTHTHTHTHTLTLHSSVQEQTFFCLRGGEIIYQFIEARGRQFSITAEGQCHESNGAAPRFSMMILISFFRYRYCRYFGESDSAVALTLRKKISCLVRQKNLLEKVCQSGAHMG